MVISISAPSIYSDGYYFSFHVGDKLQPFGLAISTVVDLFSTLDISFPINYFFL